MQRPLRPIRALAAIAMAVSLTVTLGACAGIAGVPMPAAAPVDPSTAVPAPLTTTAARPTSAASTPPPVTVTATATVTMPASPQAARTETTTVLETAPSGPTDEPAADSDPQGYSDSQIRSEVGQAFDVVNGYWVDLFDTWVDKQGNPIQWWTPQLYDGDGFYDSTTGRRGPTCGGEPVPASNATYCVSTGTISWDMEFFRTYGTIGDGVFYVTVAHEVGHAAQMRFRHDGEGAAVPTDVGPAVELQADCLAGATLSKAEQDGHVQLGSGNLDEIASFLAEISDNAGDHGTADQRIGAFHRGFDGDIESCLLQRQR